MLTSRALLPWLLLALLPVAAHLPALTPWFRFDPLFVVSGVTDGTWRTNGWLPGYPGWIDGNAGVTTEALGSLAARQWLSGHIPWWNPFSGVGLPLVAEGQTTAMFLPFGLLLGLPHGLLLLRMVLVALAGLFTNALLRRLGLGVMPAFTGAALFALNGTFAWFAHGPIMPVAFLPLLLLGIEQARGGRFPIAAVLGTAWSFLAGFPETAALNLAFAGVWAALRLWQAPHRAAYVLRAGGAVACGLLLAAPAIWPFLEALPREFLGIHATPTGGGWARADLALILFPYSHGAVMAAATQGRPVDIAWFRVGGYLNLAIAALALAALRRKAPDAAHRALLAAWIALTAARAAGWPPAMALFGLVPMLNQAMVHLYMMPGWSMAAAVLAAHTLQDWQQGRRPGWAVAALVLLPAGVLALVWSAPALASAPPALAVAAACGPLAVLAALGWLLRTPAAPRRAALVAGLITSYATALFVLPLFAGTHGRKLDVPGIRFLQSHTALSRVVSFGPLVPNYGAMFGVPELSDNYLPVPAAWVTAIRALISPDNDGVNFYQGGLPAPDKSAALVSAYQSLGAAYALTWPSQDFPPAPGAPVLAYQDSIMKIWALPSPAPYWQADGCVLTGSRDTLTTNCAHPSDLRRLELYWPGWTATVNATPAPVRADGIFQRITLPAGHSEVTFRYAPPGAAWAWLCCASGALALAWALAVPRLLPAMARWRHSRYGNAAAGGVRPH